MLSPFDLLYTGAVVLNNAGVSLLERQCYDDAVECFGDALRLIQELSRAPPTPAGYPIPSAEIRARMKSASQKLAATCHFKSNANILVTNEKDTAAAIRQNNKSSSSSNANSSFLVLIRLELMSTSIPDPQTYYAGLESAIILYNFGNAQTEAASAWNLFHLSFSILESLSGQAQTNDAVIPEDYLPLGILILQRLAPASSILHKLPEYQYFSCLFCNLHDTFQQRDKMRSTLKQCAAGAA